MFIFARTWIRIYKYFSKNNFIYLFLILDFILFFFFIISNLNHSTFQNCSQIIFVEFQSFKNTLMCSKAAGKSLLKSLWLAHRSIHAFPWNEPRASSGLADFSDESLQHHWACIVSVSNEKPDGLRFPFPRI